MDNIWNEKLSTVINRYRIPICALLIVLIIMGVAISNIFSIAAFILFAAVILFADEKLLACLLLFMVTQASLFKLSPNSISLFTIGEIIIVIRIFLTRKFSVNVAVGALLYFGYILLGTYIRGQADYMQHIKQLENILILYTLVVISKDVPFERLATYYIMGMLVSSTIGLCVQGNATFFAYSKFKESDGYLRFCGLFGDPNYYSVNLMIAFTMLLVMRARNKVSVDMFWLLYGIMSVFGFMTYSKSFMLMYVIMFIVTAVIVLKKSNPIENCLLALVLVSVLIVGLAEDGFIRFALERITTASNMHELTTGRSTIWEYYLELIFSDAGIIMFGTGLTNTPLNGHVPHNIYIECVFYLGIAGVLVLLVAIWFCLSKRRPWIKRSGLNYFGWIILAMMYFFLQSLFYYVFMYNIFLCYLIYTTDLKKQIDKEEEEI